MIPKSRPSARSTIPSDLVRSQGGAPGTPTIGAWSSPVGRRAGGSEAPSPAPARRRAQRLSFSVWAMIRDRTDAARDLQAVLEVPSTSDRLRLALVRLRKLRELFRRGA